MRTSAHRELRTLTISWVLRLSTAAALAIDAYVHADLVHRYQLNQGTAAISQGDLFKIEAGVAAFAALAVILTAWRLTWVMGFLVAASALGGLLLYRYRDPGFLGPLPDMYEPAWYPEKTLAAIAEAAAVVTTALGLVLHGWWLRRTPRPPASRPATLVVTWPGQASSRPQSLPGNARTSAPRPLTTPSTGWDTGGRHRPAAGGDRAAAVSSRPARGRGLSAAAARAAIRPVGRPSRPTKSSLPRRTRAILRRARPRPPRPPRPRPTPRARSHRACRARPRTRSRTAAVSSARGRVRRRPT
jgi:hypothetical protein